MPKKTLSPLAYPYSAELWYAKQLELVVTLPHEMVKRQLFPALPGLLRGTVSLNERNDSIASRLVDILESIRSFVSSGRSGEQLANQSFSSVNATNLSNFNEAYSDTLGIQASGTLWEAELADAFVLDNVALINSVPNRYLDEVKNVVLNAVRTGSRVEDVTRLIVDRFNVAVSRAHLIAVDQIGKLQGQLNQFRQEAAGVEEYEWFTVLDERVRPLHRTLHATVRRWDTPHETEGHPGQPVRCRCSAMPVLEV